MKQRLPLAQRLTFNPGRNLYALFRWNPPDKQSGSIASSYWDGYEGRTCKDPPTSYGWWAHKAGRDNKKQGRERGIPMNAQITIRVNVNPDYRVEAVQAARAILAAAKANAEHAHYGIGVAVSAKLIVNGRRVR